MEYFDYSQSLFKKIEKTDFTKLSNSSDHPLRSLIPYVLKNFSYDKFTLLYRKETDRIIDEVLPIHEEDIEQKSKLKSIDYYKNSVNTYSWMFLFWIWYNKIEISDEDLKSLLRAEFMGMMGYRLIDIYSDDEGSNKDYLFLGNYLIRSFEQSFNDVFNSQDTFNLLNYYGLKYNEIEYIEKRNLWKSCPFNYDESFTLGYKTSPLLSLFHVIFKEYQIDSSKSNDLLRAFLYALAANQIVDDISDAVPDLAMGRETLVMSGFYNKYGINNSWTSNNIEEYLSQDRLKKIYVKLIQLFEEAVELSAKHNDIVFLLFIELGRYVYLKNFEVAPT